MDWPGGSWEATAALAGVIIGAYALVLWISIVVWTYLDIRARTPAIGVQVASVAAVLLFNIAGLFVYLMLRPKETMAEAYERSLEEEALIAELNDRPACVQCGRSVRDDFLVCPHCAAQLREPCVACGKPLAAAWVACPYCGVEPRTAAAQRAAGRRTRRAMPGAPLPASGAFSAIVGDGAPRSPLIDDTLPEAPSEPPPFTRRPPKTGRAT